MLTQSYVKRRVLQPVLGSRHSHHLGHCHLLLATAVSNDQFLFLHLLQLPLRQAILFLLKREGSGIRINCPKDWSLILWYPYLCIALYSFCFHSGGKWLIYVTKQTLKCDGWYCQWNHQGDKPLWGAVLITLHGMGGLIVAVGRTMFGHVILEWVRWEKRAEHWHARLDCSPGWGHVTSCSRPWCPGLSPWHTIFQITS